MLRWSLPFTLLAAACHAGGPVASSAPAVVSATPAADAAVVEAADGGRGGPFLWRVDGAGEPSYLFGTIHLGVDGATEIPPPVWSALDGSERFVMEADLGAVSPDVVARLSEGHAGTQALLGPAEWRRLVALVGSERADALAEQAPWLAQSALLQAIFPTPVPLDFALARRARGKEVHYLEGWRDQLRLMSETVTDEDVRELLDPSSESRRRLSQLIDVYRSGDLVLLRDVTLAPDDVAEDPERFERMFFARNRAWMDTLGPLLEQGSVFVAVGAGHVPGEQGLLALIEKRGFRVQRIHAAPTN